MCLPCQSLFRCVPPSCQWREAQQLELAHLADCCATCRRSCLFAWSTLGLFHVSSMSLRVLKNARLAVQGGDQISPLPAVTVSPEPYTCYLPVTFQTEHTIAAVAKELAVATYEVTAANSGIDNGNSAQCGCICRPILA